MNINGDLPPLIIEELSKIEHERWSIWHNHLFSKSILNDDGSLTIPSELVSSMISMATLPYEMLSEDLKVKNRSLVLAERARYLKIILLLTT